MKSTKLLLILATILPSLAMADSFSVNYGVNTTHINHEEWMNEDNGLIAIEWMGDKHGVNASSFVNTYGNDTLTLGGSYSLFEYNFINLDLMYGIVKGYEEREIPTVIDKDYGFYFAPRFSASVDLYKELAVKASVQLFGEAVVTTVGLEINF